MSLSFREQAAIALYCGPGDAAKQAQDLADSCCASWGHDWESNGYHLCTSCAQYTTPTYTCRRCGLVEKPKEKP